MSETRPAEHWEQRYRDGDLPWDAGRPEPQLVDPTRSLDVPTRLALDLGCGTGSNTRWLAQQGYQALGLDISATAIQTAQAGAVQAGLDDIRFVCTSVLEPLPVQPQSIGLALDRGCFHVLGDDDRPTYARRVADALAPGGWWLILCGNADEPRGENEQGPPQLTAAQVIQHLDHLYEIHALQRTRFSGPDNQPTRLAWRTVLRRR